MQGLVKSAVFIDAVIILWLGIVVACFQLHQRQFIWRIAVDFVCAHMDEHGLGTELARGLKEIHGANSVDIKVNERNAGGFIMGRLRGAVNDAVEAVLLEQVKYVLATTDIEMEMLKTAGDLLETREIPGGVTRSSKKLSAHIIIYTIDVVSISIEIDDRLRADEPIASCHQYAHTSSPLLCHPVRRRLRVVSSVSHQLS